MKLLFVEGRGRVIILEKQGQKFFESFNLHKDIKNKLECIMIGRGEEEGPQTPIK